MLQYVPINNSIDCFFNENEWPINSCTERSHQILILGLSCSTSLTICGCSDPNILQLCLLTISEMRNVHSSENTTLRRNSLLLSISANILIGNSCLVDESVSCNFCTNWILYAWRHNLLWTTLWIVDLGIPSSLLVHLTDLHGLCWNDSSILSTSCSETFLPHVVFFTSEPVSSRVLCHFIVCLSGSSRWYFCWNLFCTVLGY